MAKSRKAARSRIGQRAIITAGKRAVWALFHAVEKPNSKRAYAKALRYIGELGALAQLFEEVAARNYRTIKIGGKAKRAHAFVRKVRKA